MVICRSTGKSAFLKMKIFKEIFARFWALWGLISFVATFLLIFIPSMIAYLIPGRKGQAYFIYVSRIWMNIWLALIGCRLKLKGWNNFKKGETYIVLYNHNAFLDVPISAPYVPGPNKTIAKKSFTVIPLFGWFYAKGAVLVDRKNDKSRSKSFEDMKRVLKMGYHMCIYPEGTRNRTKEPLKTFYDGAFRLSKATGNKIIPAVISGTKAAMPINKTFYLLPLPIELEFFPAISPENKTVEELKQEARTIMLNAYVSNPRNKFN